LVGVPKEIIRPRRRTLGQTPRSKCNFRSNGIERRGAPKLKHMEDGDAQQGSRIEFM